MANNKDFIVNNAVEVGGPTKVTLGTITSNNLDLSTGNHFADTPSENVTYTFSNAGDVQMFQLEVTETQVSIGFNISAAAYDSKSLSVVTQDSNPQDVVMGDSDTKIYVMGNGNDTVYQYDLTTANDISTASYASKSFQALQPASVGGGYPSGIVFKSDGTKMFISGTVNDVYQYSLSTAWDVSTASYDSVSFDSSSQTTGQVNALDFKPDGTIMYIGDASTDAVWQYTLSTAWDLSTASYASKTFSVSSQSTALRGVRFSSDGAKMFVLNNNVVYEYDLTTAWDISTASYNSVSYSMSSEFSTGTGIAFNSDGGKLYAISSLQDSVYQYSTSGPASINITWPASVTWLSGNAPSATSGGVTDLFTFITTDGGTSYLGRQSGDNFG